MIDAVVVDLALAAQRNGIVEFADPERAPFNEIVARYLKAVGDPRKVVKDPKPDTGTAVSRSTRLCRWARRTSAASVSTNGSAAHRQQPDPRIQQPKHRGHETHPLRSACRHAAVRQPGWSAMTRRVCCRVNGSSTMSISAGGTSSPSR